MCLNGEESSVASIEEVRAQAGNPASALVLRWRGSARETSQIITVLRSDGLFANSLHPLTNTEEGIHWALVDSFFLPSYYGKNLNALDEVLRDMSWLEQSGYVLLVRAMDLREADQAVLDGFRHVLLDAGRYWREKLIPFKIVLL